MKRPSAFYLTSLALVACAVVDWFGRKGSLVQPVFIGFLALLLFVFPRIARWPIALVLAYAVAMNLLFLYWTVFEPSLLEPSPSLTAFGLRILALGVLAYLGFQILYGRETRRYLTKETIPPNQTPEPTSTAVTPPADAGDRASGTRGSS